MTPFRPAASDELEGAYLSVVSTLRDLGVDVYSGYAGPEMFSFLLEMQAKRRWLYICKELLQSARGYIVHICQQLHLKGGVLSRHWSVTIRADRIVYAADRFRKDLIQAWNKAYSLRYNELPELGGWE